MELFRLYMCVLMRPRFQYNTVVRSKFRKFEKHGISQKSIESVPMDLDSGHN